MIRADGGFQVDGQWVISGDAWIEGDRIKQGSIDSSEIQNRSITSIDLALNSVGASELAPNSVYSEDIVDGEVTSADIKDGTVTSSDIKNRTITLDDILISDFDSRYINTVGDNINGNLTVDGNLTVKNGKITGDGSGLSNLPTVPRGVIVMWSGSIDKIPDGWALCNGDWYDPDDPSDHGPEETPTRTVKTPDLRGKFIVGYDSRDSDYNVIGRTGGEKFHKLTIDEMPSHSHSYTAHGHTHPYYDKYLDEPRDGEDWDEDSWEKNKYEDKRMVTEKGFANITIHPTGGDQPHENRPPYYALAFIMKL